MSTESLASIVLRIVISCVMGCSGTLSAIEQVLLAQSSNPWNTGIRLINLQVLATDLSSFNTIEEVSCQGLSEDQRSIFVLGVAIVLGLFEVLNVDTMRLSQRGLRDGVIENCFAQSGLKFQQGGQQ